MMPRSVKQMISSRDDQRITRKQKGKIRLVLERVEIEVEACEQVVDDRRRLEGECTPGVSF